MSSKAGDFEISRTRVFSQMILALNHHKDRWYFSLSLSPPISTGRKEYLRAPVPWDLPRQPIKWVCHDGKQAISVDVERKEKKKTAWLLFFMFPVGRKCIFRNSALLEKVKSISLSLYFESPGIYTQTLNQSYYMYLRILIC